MAIDIAAIPALGVEPIAPDSPAGENLQDDFKFDQLQADVQALINQLGTTAEMDAVGDREPPKWENVALQAFDMLKTRSKDIRIASFLTIATAHVQGYSGLAACIEMVSGLLTNFWDTMYPPLKLLRGRVNTLGFIATHVAGESDEPGGLITLRVAQLREELDEAKSPSASLDAQRLAVEKMTAELEALKACQEQIGKLRDLIYEKFPQDKLPAVTSLTDAVKAALPELEQLVAQNKPREPAAPSAPAAGGEPRPAAAASRPAPSAAAISAESPEEAFKAMGRLAPMIRQADATHPAAYRLSRWAAWSALTMLPPTTDGVKTRVPEPPKQEIDQCNALLASANWMALLNQSEERMQTTPLWLDRQFHVYSALGGLGGAYKAAQEAVRGEVANLLRRLPGLQNLAFAGGMPLADAATQNWIQDVVLADSGGGGGGSARAGALSTDGADGLGEALDDARSLASEGRLADALRKLQEGARSRDSGRARFLWRMAQAQLAADNGKAKQMAPVWEDLVGEIDRRQLESWEPDLCLAVFRALWQATRGDKERAELNQEMHRRLCRLDPAMALEG